MKGLVRAELRRGWAAWSGIVLVSAVASLTFCVALSFLETGLAQGGDFLEGSLSFLVALLMFGIPSGVVVTSAVARLSVDLHRPVYARWQLAGVSPAQTARVVMTQLALSGLLGGALGFAAAVLVVPPFAQAVFAGDSTGWDQIRFLVGPLTAGIAIPLTALNACAGGMRAARAAARTSPLAVLREPEPVEKRMRWWRWGILLAVCGGAAAGVSGILTAEERSVVTGQLPLLPVYLTLVVVAAGPLLYPAVMRAWTALIPAAASASWYLARHEARFHLSRSTASITPLFVGASLLGGLMTMAATTGASMAASGDGSNWELQIVQVLLLVGGPVLLGAVGAAVVIFMGNDIRGSEQALLRASGATDRVILASAIWQAVIHVTTAALLASAVLVTTAFIAAAGLSRFVPPVPVVDAGAAAVLAGVGLALTLVATALPAAARLRESVASRLAAA
ncbi:hypothetical protein [Microbacterium tumbae]